MLKILYSMANTYRLCSMDAYIWKLSYWKHVGHLCYCVFEIYFVVHRHIMSTTEKPCPCNSVSVLIDTSNMITPQCRTREN